MKRPLPLVEDAFEGCADQAHLCPYTTCRHHLGSERAFQGATFRCSLVVAHAYPHGLSPQHVAVLLGVEESECQKIESTAYHHARLAAALLKLEAVADYLKLRAVRLRAQNRRVQETTPTERKIIVSNDNQEAA